MAILGSATYKLDADNSRLNRGLAKAEQTSRESSKRIAGNIAKVGAAAVAMGAAAGFALFKLGKHASDLQESVNAVNITFLDSSGTIHTWAKDAARTFGLAKSDFNELAAETGGIMANWGISNEQMAANTVKLIQRATDIGSARNISTEQAVSALTQAIRGETEAIRKYGGDVTDATLQTWLLNKGLNQQVTEMDQATKGAFRLELLLEQTSRMAGDFENTSTGAANATKILRAQIKDTAATIGQGLLPVFEKVLPWVQSVVVQFREWAERNPKLMRALVLGAAAVAVLAGALGAVLLPLSAIIFIAPAVGTAWGIAFGPIGLIALVILGLVIGLALLWVKWDALMALWNQFPGWSKPVVIALISMIPAFGQIFLLMVGLIWAAKNIGNIWNGLKTAWGWVSSFVTEWYAAILTILFPVGGLALLVKKHWSIIWNGLKTAWDTSWKGTKTGLGAAWGGIKTAWNFVFDPLKTSAVAIWDGLETVWSTSWGLIKGAATTVWDALVVAWHVVLDPFKTAALSIWDGLEVAWGIVWGGIKGAATSVWDALVVAWNFVFDPLKTAAMAIWNGLELAWGIVWGLISGAATVVWDALVVAWNTVIGGLKTAALAIWNGLSISWGTSWSGISKAATVVWDALVVSWNTVIGGLKTAALSIWDGLEVAWNTSWGGISKAATVVWDALVVAWDTVIGGLKKAALAIWDGLELSWGTSWGGISKAATVVWDALVVSWDTVIGGLKTAVMWVWGGIQAVWGIVWGGISKAATVVWDALVLAWNTVIGPLKTGIETIWDGINAVWDTAWGGMKATVKGALNLIIGWINKLIGAWNNISFRVPSISLPTFTIGKKTVFGKTVFPGASFGGGSFGGQTFSTPNISRIPILDEGAVVTGPTIAGLAMNNRPEAVVPLDRAGGLGRGLTVQVYMDGATILGGDLEDTIVEVVDRAVRRGVVLGAT